MARAPRTPLLRHLRRALASARRANALGLPADEVQSAPSPSRASGAPISRRHFVVASSAAAALWACRRDEPTSVGAAGGPPPSAPLEVAVVGAGLAGLTAAYRLMQAGVAVQVFEGQGGVGGRVSTLRAPGDAPEAPARVAELGGEFIDSGHQALLGLTREFGLDLEDYFAEPEDLARDVWFFEGRRRTEREIVRAFRPVAGAMDAAWETVSGETITYDAPNGGEAIDRLSIAEWLEKAGAEGWFRRLLEVAYTIEYGLDADRQSAWNLLMLIDTEPDPFRVFGDSDERYHVRGGNDQVARRLAERLGDRIATDRTLEAVTAMADGRYELSLRRGGTSRTVAARHVVLALPFSTLREVRLDVDLPAVKRRAIAELGYGTNAKLLTTFAERVWRTSSAGKSVGSVTTDLGFQACWEATRQQPGTAGILIAYAGGRHGLDLAQGLPNEHGQRFAAELETVFPGVAALRRSDQVFPWPTWPWSKGSYSCYTPGQWTTLCGAEGERVGNLHFCGEHTSLDFQGFMEGACESGERAAREVLGDRAAPAAPAAPATG